MTDEQKKQMMAWQYKKQEEMKVTQGGGVTEGTLAVGCWTRFIKVVTNLSCGFLDCLDFVVYYFSDLLTLYLSLRNCTWPMMEMIT